MKKLIVVIIIFLFTLSSICSCLFLVLIFYLSVHASMIRLFLMTKKEGTPQPATQTCPFCIRANDMFTMLVIYNHHMRCTMSKELSATRLYFLVQLHIRSQLSPQQQLNHVRIMAFPSKSLTQHCPYRDMTVWLMSWHECQNQRPRCFRQTIRLHKCPWEIFRSFSSTNTTKPKKLPRRYLRQLWRY